MDGMLKVTAMSRDPILRGIEPGNSPLSTRKQEKSESMSGNQELPLHAQYPMLYRSRTSKEAGSQLASHKALLALSIRWAQKWE